MTWEDVIADYHLTVTRIGRQYRGPCPIHRGSNPTSFAITPSDGFHCFTCGAGGGIPQFIRAMGGTPDAAALSRSPTPSPSSSFWLPQADGRSAVTPLSPLDHAHPFFHRRGIHEATARFFGMGFFRGKPPLGGRIIIPLHDADGRLVGHQGRALTDDEPRYWFQQNVPRTSILFNLHRVKASCADTVVLVEGALDAAAVHQIGIPNVVASLSCHVSANQRALLSRFRRVVILFDADTAGAEATASMKAELGVAVIPVALPKADPCAIKGVVLADVLASAGVGSH